MVIVQLVQDQGGKEGGRSLTVEAGTRGTGTWPLVDVGKQI